MDLVARLTLKDDFSGRIKKATSHLSRMQSATSRATAGVKTFGSSVAGLTSAIGITAALSKGFNMVRNSVGRALDRIDVMERFQRTMTTMLGTADKAKAALQGIDAAVKGTAYGLDTGARAVQNFVSRGIEVGKATKWFEAMGDAVAFYGDGSNEQLESVTTAMAKMATSGKVSMQQMETLSLAGIDAVGMYAKAVGKSSTDVQKALSKGKIGTEQFFDVVTKAMMEGTNGVQKIAGTAKDAGATWAGAIANMQFAVVRGVTSIITALDEMLANNGLPSMREMVGAFGKRFESVLKGAASAIQPFIDVMKKAYGVVKPLAPAIKTFGKALGIALVSVVAGAKMLGILAGAIAFLASPVGLAVGAVTGLILGFQTLYKHSDKFRGFIDTIAGSVKGLFKIMSGDSAGGLSAMLDAGLDTGAIRKVFAFADGVKSAFSTVKNFVMSFVDSIKPRVAEFVAFLAQKWQDLQPGIATMLEAFATAKEVAVNVFTTLWSALQPVFSALGVAFRIIADVAVSVFNNVIAPAVKFVWTMFQTLWKIVGPILEYLGALIGATFEVLKIVWDTILKPVADFLLGQFKQAFEDVMPVIDAVGGVFEWIGDKISGAADWLKGFTDILSKFKVPSWLSRLGGGGTVKFESTETSTDSGGGGKSHYHGIDYIPYDGYEARLHRGEKIVSAQEVREGKSGGNMFKLEKLADQIIVREDADIDRITDQLFEKLNGAVAGGAHY